MDAAHVSHAAPLKQKHINMPFKFLGHSASSSLSLSTVRRGHQFPAEKWHHSLIYSVLIWTVTSDCANGDQQLMPDVTVIWDLGVKDAWFRCFLTFMTGIWRSSLSEDFRICMRFDLRFAHYCVQYKKTLVACDQKSENKDKQHRINSRNKYDAKGK